MHRNVPRRTWGTLSLVAMVISGAVDRARADHPSVVVGAGSGSAINTESAVPLARGAWSLGLGSEVVQFREFSDDRLIGLRRRRPEADLHSTESLAEVSLGVFYGVTENFTLGLRLPYVRRAGIREPEHGEGGEASAAAHRVGEGGGSGGGSEGGAHSVPPGVATMPVLDLGSSEGIGDLSLLGQYRVWQDEWVHAALIAGVKMPTGRTSERARVGGRLETEFQPGSGSWDGLLGVAATFPFEHLTVDTSVVYTIVGDGSHDTNLGDVVTYGAALSHRLGGHGHDAHRHDHHAHEHLLAWDLVLELNGESRERETVDSRSDPDSGGNTLWLSPGVRLGIGAHLSLHVSLGIPLVVDLNGDQVAPEYRIVSGLGWGF